LFRLEASPVLFPEPLSIILQGEDSFYIEETFLSGSVIFVANEMVTCCCYSFAWAKGLVLIAGFIILVDCKSPLFE
jgi:hypothetical protein